MSTGVDAKSYNGASEVEAVGTATHNDHAYDLDEKAGLKEYKNDAVAAEDAEHNMGVLEAMKAYPMASFWAFVMSCTIVSYLLFSPISIERCGKQQKTIGAPKLDHIYNYY